jgi:hypothetical protein
MNGKAESAFSLREFAVDGALPAEVDDGLCGTVDVVEERLLGSNLVRPLDPGVAPALCPAADLLGFERGSLFACRRCDKRGDEDSGEK